MGVTEELADELAMQVIRYVDASGDEQVINDIVKVLGATSQTAEEAFLTSMRVRRANLKARALLAERIRRFQEQSEGAGRATSPQATPRATPQATPRATPGAGTEVAPGHGKRPAKPGEGGGIA